MRGTTEMNFYEQSAGGVGFLGSPFAPSLVLGFRTPKLPLPLCGRRGLGDEGQTCMGMQKTAFDIKECEG